MIANLNGDFETVDYTESRCIKIYDNVENEEYPIHWHNAIEIIYPLENRFTAICGGTEFVLEENDILIIPAGELHTLKATPGHRLILLCDNRLFKDNPALTQITSALSVPLCVNAEWGKDLLSSLGQTLQDIFGIYNNGGNMPDVYIYIKLLKLITRIKEHQLDSAELGSSDKYASKFQFIIKYIEQNYMYDITLDGLAELAGYSKYHFSRIFKQYSSTTFIEFVNRRRIKAAELLLLDADLSITDVAMRSGFASLTTFNRTFKEIKKCTPSEFKKLYRGSNTTENM